jgi:hypothetical protein
LLLPHLLLPVLPRSPTIIVSRYIKYNGNYTLSNTLPDARDSLDPSPIFFARSEAPSTKNDSYHSELFMSFRAAKFIPARSLSLEGLSSTNGSFFFYYKTTPQRDELKLIEILERVMISEKIEGIHDGEGLYNALVAYFKSPGQVRFGIQSIEVAAFQVTEGSHPNHFLLDKKAEGYFRSSDLILDFYGFEFNEDLFVAEGRILGVWFAVALCLSFMAWKSLCNSFVSATQLSQLSLHSYVLHIAFDFSFAVFVFNLSELSSRFSTFYTMLFLLMMSLYFIVEMRQVSEVWRASLGDLDDLDTMQRRQSFMDFFFEIAVALFVLSTATSYVFQAPWICVAILYSFFIPQIVHSTRSPLRKTKDVMFLVLISLSRLLPVYYFACYRDNILGFYSPTAAIATTAYVGSQLLVVLLQNWLGGAFFLLKRLRPVGLFDYRAVVPEEGAECSVCLTQMEPGEDAMGTPCGHLFHRECLTRWMDMQMVCPLCRRPLPGPDETVPG